MSGMTPLDLRVRRCKSGATVITVSGEIDLDSSVRLREKLISAVERGTTVLDLAGVGFCDSNGMQVLLEAEHAGRANGSVLRLAAVPTAVERVLEMSMTLDVFDVYPDVEAALKD
ncbi:STAS domain-containing protein [Actinospica sp. MGRD01-02]|uniref:Anti-sigma factor antagonist n=1 Tax=Actinospica acidithermotolerans TaxID=2828514 RepID=A0A941EFW1_9ACTN|nr:STAS domain-containing protein [Actinospica acidithermotolerans]MBR7830672.1 STAS domain-containing protein [Actinospica acidithermotolerans]